MKILVLNGPNINMLGIREPEIYGRQTYADLLALLEQTAREESVEIAHYQSNHEGCLVDKIQEAYGRFDGIVIQSKDRLTPRWLVGEPCGKASWESLKGKQQIP